MKSKTMNVFVSFLFLSVSIEVLAGDQTQDTLTMLDPSDVWQPIGQSAPLLRLKRNADQKSKAVSSAALHSEQGSAKRLPRYSGSPMGTMQGVKLPEGKDAASTRGVTKDVSLEPDKLSLYSIFKYIEDQEKMESLTRQIKEIEARGGRRSPAEEMNLDKLRMSVAHLRKMGAENERFLLNKMLGKFFSKNDDKIKFKLPKKLLKDCLLQAMLHPRFSPSCNEDRSYSAKQCSKKRCWCSTRKGEMHPLYSHRGLHGDGFYFGIDGVLLECPKQ